MTGQLNVNPNDLIEVGGRWYQRVPMLDGTAPPAGSGAYPSTIGATALTGAAAGATGDLQEQLAGMAANMGASGGAYGKQEASSASSMDPSKISGVLNDGTSIGNTLLATGPQLLQPIVGAFSAAASAGASAASSIVSALSHGSGGGGGPTGNAPQVALPAIEGENQPEEHHEELHQQDLHESGE
jgi:hypothetical protein